MARANVRIKIRAASIGQTLWLRHSRRSGAWPAMMMFEFHQQVNCPAWAGAPSQK